VGYSDVVLSLTLVVNDPKLIAAKVGINKGLPHAGAPGSWFGFRMASSVEKENPKLPLICCRGEVTELPPAPMLLKSDAVKL
jgi:hypothetical protein